VLKDGENRQEKIMARLTLVTCLLLMIPVEALAQSRHDISAMSCERVQSILSSEGSAILRYRSPRIRSLPLYDVYVASGRSCGFKMNSLASTVYVAGGQPCRVRKCVRIQSD
jgi:hypothetical protein